MNKFDQERLLQIILAPLVSEKSTYIADKNNQVVFVVSRTATKPEVRAAVEQLFKVKVTSVQMSVIKGKVKRSGKNFGRRSSVKKAFVCLEKGQEISFIEGVSA
jgi:large subunit ribosomal protein L23